MDPLRSQPKRRLDCAELNVERRKDRLKDLSIATRHVAVDDEQAVRTDRDVRPRRSVTTSPAFACRPDMVRGCGTTKSMPEL